MVMGMANLAMVTGNIGREGVGVNPLRGQNNVQGSCDMGSFPHEFPGYRHVSQRRRARRSTRSSGARRSTPSPGCASPTCSTPRSPAPSAGSTSRARTSPSPTPTPSTSRPPCGRWTSSSSRTCSSTRPRASPTSSCPARRSWRRTAPSPTPSAGSTGCVPVFPSKVGMDEWEITCAIGHGDGLRHVLRSPRRRSWTRSPPPPRRSRVSRSRGSTSVGSMQWPVYDAAPPRHADHARRRVRARQGPAGRDRVRPDDRALDAGSSR